MQTTISPTNDTLFSHLASLADRYSKVSPSLDIQDAILLVVTDWIQECGGYASESAAVDLAAKTFATWRAGEFSRLPATSAI